MDLGQHTTLTDPDSILDPEVIAIAERITPLMASEFGAVWDLFTLRAAPFETEEFEILTRAYTAPVFAYTAGAGDGWDSASDTTALAITDISNISLGDILLVDDEIVVVSATNGTTDVDVYERGAGDTVGATHGVTGNGQIIGNAHIEGTADGRAMAEDTATLTNFLQLVEEIVDLSKADSEQARKTGRTEVDLKAEGLERVMRDLALSAIFGTARVGTASIPSLTRGLLSHLQDTPGVLETAVGGAYTELVLQDLLDDVREAGGGVNAIVMSIANKRIFNDFTGADQVQVDRAVREGGHVLDAYIADGLGRIPAVVDIDFPNDRVAVVNSRFLTKGWKVDDTLSFAPFTNVNPRASERTCCQVALGSQSRLLDAHTR